LQRARRIRCISVFAIGDGKPDKILVGVGIELGSLQKILDSFADVSTKQLRRMKVLASKAGEHAGIARRKTEGLLVLRVYPGAETRTSKKSSKLDLAAVEISEQAMRVG